MSTAKATGYLQVPISKLKLNISNARHEFMAEEHEIIDYLLNNEKVPKLAKDIAENGLSPLDIIGVYQEENGSFTVLEGNRRTCALILLNNPKKAPAKHIGVFQKLAKNLTLPKKIRIYAFSERRDSDIWIERKHNGEQGGIGTKAWNSNQKGRHFKQYTLASGIFEYVKKHKIIEAVELTDLALTTSARYFGNPDIRAAFGITTMPSNPDIKINVPFHEFDAVLKQFYTDAIYQRNKVSSRSKKKDWLEYIDRLTILEVVPVTRTEEMLLKDRDQQEAEPTTVVLTGHDDQCDGDGTPSETKTPVDSTASTEGATTQTTSDDDKNQTDTKKNNPNPDTRKYLIPSDFKVHISDSLLKKTFDELRCLDCEQTPLAVAVTCRIFLEKIYHDCYKKIFNTEATQKTHIFLQDIIQHIDKKRQSLTRQQQGALGALKRLQSDQNHALSPLTLSLFAHGLMYPTAKQLKTEWDNISAIILYMLEIKP